LGATPGVGIVVVRDTQIIYLKGFGYADAEGKRAFTATTPFYIASTTKSFTGLAAAILEQQGAWRLDDPLSKHVPSAKLSAPLSADSISIRDLLTHTHGIASGPVDMRLAYTGEYSGDAELIRLLAEHGPRPSGRAYEYSNLGYNVGAIAMDAVTRENWRETLQRMLFTPLGMTSTSAYVSKYPRASVALPYRAVASGFTPAYFGKTDANMQSAGGLMTTPADMGRWLEVHINGGKLDGRQVLPAAAVAETHKILAPVSGSARGLRQLGYGLGWQVAAYQGDTLLIHGGGFTGWSTHMSFVPGRKVGVSVMANNSPLGGPLADLMAFAIYDVLLGRPAITADSIAAIGGQLQLARANIEADRARRAARPQNLPYALEAYAGRFENPAWGRLEIAVVGGKLEARMGAAWSAVEVFDNTRNQLRTELFGNGQVATVEMKDGRAESVVTAGATFRRVGIGAP
jgi:CubicO group peptidase (beta-lactamase class C family)